MKWLTPLITALGFAVVVFVLVDRLPVAKPSDPTPLPSIVKEATPQQRLNRMNYLVEQRERLRDVVGDSRLDVRVEFDEIVRQITRDAIDYAKDHPATRP